MDWRATWAFTAALLACTPRPTSTAGKALYDLVPALKELSRHLLEADSISSDTLGEMARLGQRMVEESKSLQPDQGQDVEEGVFPVVRLLVRAEGQLLSMLATDPVAKASGVPGESNESLQEGIMALGVSELAILALDGLDGAMVARLAREQAQDLPVQLSGEARERILAMAQESLSKRLERVGREALFAASRCDAAFGDPVNPLSLILRNESVAFGSLSMATVDLPADAFIPVVRARAETGSRFFREILPHLAPSVQPLSTTRLLAQRVTTSEAIVASLLAVVEGRGEWHSYVPVIVATAVVLLLCLWWYRRRRPAPSPVQEP